MYKEIVAESIIDFVDVNCPGCGAQVHEPCSVWCDDAEVGMVRKARGRAQWDDGERW